MVIRHINVGIDAPDSEEIHAGLRMTAAEFLELPQSPIRYELVDGIVVMSPSPELPHQSILSEIADQIFRFLSRRPIGRLLWDSDVQLRHDLVYRPDLLFVSTEKLARMHRRVTEIPDLVVEVISPSSRGYDLQTKRTDYEAAGVGEYWVVDPQKSAFTFLVLRDGRYAEAPSTTDRYASTVLPGLELNLARVRALF